MKISYQEKMPEYKKGKNMDIIDEFIRRKDKIMRLEIEPSEYKSLNTARSSFHCSLIRLGLQHDIRIKARKNENAIYLIKKDKESVKIGNKYFDKEDIKNEPDETDDTLTGIIRAHIGGRYA